MRRKYFSIALLSGFLLVAATGCDEMSKADDQVKPDKPEVTEKPKVEAKKPKDTSFDFSGFPTSDPSILAALQSRRVLAEREEELLEKLDEIRTLLASAKADPSRMKESVGEFLQLAKDVRKIVIQAGEALSGLTLATEGLARELKHSPKAYRMAAEGFRERARDYTEKRLKEQVLSFADDYETISKAMPERVSKLREFQKQLPKMKLKIREARSFLDDMNMYLESHPGAGTEDPRDRYSAQFDAFVHSFSELVRALEEFRNVLRSQAVSVSIHKSYEKEVRARFDVLVRMKHEQEVRVAAALEALKTQLVQLQTSQHKNVEQQKEPAPSTERVDQTVASVVPEIASQSVTYSFATCAQPVTYQNSCPCRCRLFPLLRRE